MPEQPRVFPCISTKLQVPLARTGLVARPHLVDRLRKGAGQGRRLSLISGPPGFGKTTLLREWAETDRTRDIAWITLDAGDNDAHVFSHNLLEAIHRSGGSESPTDEPFRQDTDPLRRETRMLERLAETGRPTLLFLDDYHHVRNISIHNKLAYLIEKGPVHLHIAVGTREDPPLPLARLRALDLLTEIRAQDLRFRREEAGLFLHQTMALNCSREEVDLLAVRTDGWVTGLQLAALAIRQQMERVAGNPDMRSFVRAFSGDDRFIIDYLFAEVLDGAPEEIRDFLRQTSILGRLSAPLCDALTGGEDSQRMLEQLEAGNIFLLPLDNRKEWYRYHALFAQVVRLSLQPEERRELHRNAEIWFRANGMPEEAAEHERSAVGGKEFPSDTQSQVEPLSAREIEVLRLVEEGLSNQEIGEKLIIATSTVKRHMSNIYGKLQVGSRTQAVAAARKIRLL